MPTALEVAWLVLNALIVLVITTVVYTLLFRTRLTTAIGYGVLAVCAFIVMRLLF